MNKENREAPAGRYVLSGASGMLGKASRAALVNRGDEVIQLVRREPAGPGELRWDPSTTQPLVQPEVLEGVTAAVHLSGSSVTGRRWTPAYREEMASSRVHSTGVLAKALSGLRQPPKVFLVASAIGFYGNRGDEILDESSASGTGFVPAMCQQWEAAARPALEAGIRVVHLRFGVVLSAGEGALAQMIPAFRIGLGGRLGSGRQWMSWIGLEDTVAAVLFAIDNPKLSGPVNVTSPNPTTNAEFTRALAKQLHRPALFPVPALAARIIFGQMAREVLLASLRVVPCKLVEAGFRFSHPGIDQALQEALKK